MIILDTNVLSEVMRVQSDLAVTAWLDAQPIRDLWLSSITVFEISCGIETLPNGKRKTRLAEALDDLLVVDFGGRIADFDEQSARLAGQLFARQKATGWNPDFRDAQIAGIATAHQARLATRNTKHFEGTGLVLINPWDRSIA